MIRKFLIENHEYFIKYDTKNDTTDKKINDSAVCLNWWPVSTGVCVQTNEILPHPLCKVCANWLTDIEDIVKFPSTTIKRSKCINQLNK